MSRRSLRRRSAPDEPPSRLGLSDHLAVERTRLANERTILAYFRTALALVAGSVTLLHFFDTTAARVTGWALLPVGLVLLTFGVVRYVRVRRRVERYARLSQPDAADTSVSRNP